MKKLFRALLISAGVALVATGCASGPQYKDVASAIPTLAADHGRIYFYRSDSLGGGMIQPEIKLNDKVVGRSVPGGFFFLDEEPGDYTVSTSTEVTREVKFALHAGDTKYVQTSVSMGLLVGHVTPTLEDAETAEPEVETLKYTGTPMSTAAK
ncbi:DUF2846 domain-containing protein [Trinickia sp. NRRL B-1857]|uniref:DUF2846 domain-containing protein n=1 Tax=Trinickia sp. NRRL B-1857 TaxID=3162879 RepID=UPI003D2BB900